jgi:hypothetical protein
MMKLPRIVFRLILGFAVPGNFCAYAQAEPKPLLQAHAHNDYEHPRPLLDALEQGFCSVEADIYLVDGQLLVAHDRAQVKPERTLQALYLEPLRQRIKKNGGRVYSGGPACTLLIDIKSDWQSLYPVLHKVLADYADILTRFEGKAREPKAVTAIITGNRAKEMFANQNVRYAALDGELEALDSAEPATLIPLISSNWRQSFQWRGVGPIPEPEAVKLKELVSKAHAQGRRIRFWAAPDQITCWRVLKENGVDLINTDDLEGLQKFLNGKP